MVHNDTEYLFKKKTRSLKDSKLRKIRYEFRTLLHLAFRDKMVEIQNDLDLKYSILEHNKLKIHYSRCPISCWACGNRMKDLVKDPETGFWFCVDCFED